MTLVTICHDLVRPVFWGFAPKVESAADNRMLLGCYVVGCWFWPVQQPAIQTNSQTEPQRGGKTTAQGNALGITFDVGITALKGRNKSESRPYRGSDEDVPPTPGRCPGLLNYCPFGAHQNLRQSLRRVLRQTRLPA